MQKNNQQHRYKPPSNQAQTADLMTKQQAAQNLQTDAVTHKITQVEIDRLKGYYDRVKAL